MGHTYDRGSYPIMSQMISFFDSRSWWKSTVKTGSWRQQPQERHRTRSTTRKWPTGMPHCLLCPKEKVLDEILNIPVERIVNYIKSPYIFYKISNDIPKLICRCLIDLTFHWFAGICLYPIQLPKSLQKRENMQKLMSPLIKPTRVWISKRKSPNLRRKSPPKGNSWNQKMNE